MVALNRVIAGAMVHGAAAGLEQLRALEADPRLARHYRVAAVRAHLLEMSATSMPLSLTTVGPPPPRPARRSASS